MKTATKNHIQHSHTSVQNKGALESDSYPPQDKYWKFAVAPLTHLLWNTAWAAMADICKQY